MSRVHLTRPQRTVLDLAAVDGVRGSTTTYVAGGLVSTRVADGLVDRGLLEHAAWNGSVWTYRITPAGRTALEGVDQ